MSNLTPPNAVRYGPSLMHVPLRIETTEALDAFLAGIGRGPVALDTEADSFHHYRDRVCLVQLSAGGHDAIVDPLAEVDLSRLAPASWLRWSMTSARWVALRRRNGNRPRPAVFVALRSAWFRTECRFRRRTMR